MEIDELLKYRNDAAHASPNQVERELDNEQYENMLMLCENILRALFAIKVGAIATAKMRP